MQAEIHSISMAGWGTKGARILTRGPLPSMRLLPRPNTTAVQAKQIRALIARLASIDKPYLGLAGSLEGSAFAPIDGQESSGAFLLTNHKMGVSESLKTLVALGPAAIPFLLDALDNPTPTKLTIKAFSDGAMQYDTELSFNPVNSAERVVPRTTKVPWPDGKPILSHTVTVGDVCFVILGQIVGREYEAVRYQPTACIVVNSPVQNRQLCAAVRAIWRSDNPVQKLFYSLCEDYASVGVFDKKSLEGWDAGSNLVCGAALRLLYYFPKEFTPLLVKRLDTLNVAKTEVGEDNKFERQGIANGGVRFDKFLKAVAWSRVPAVRAALTRVFRRAEDTNALLASLPGVDDVALIRRRLEARLAALPANDDGPYGDAYNFLTILCQRTPQTTKPVVERYLKGGGDQRPYVVCLVLQEVRVRWATELLVSLLTDQRDTRESYAMSAERGSPRQAARVCDLAAQRLCQIHPELTFILRGDYPDLDAQINVIQAKLAQKH